MSRNYRLKALVLSVFLLLIAGPAWSAALQLEDVFQLTYASDPQADSRTNSVIFVRNYMDRQSDRQRSNLWQIDAKSGDMVPLTAGHYSDRMPRLSPDGKRLAYISDRSGSQQIHLLWLASGKTTVLSQLAKGASQLTWAPDGSALYFTQFVPAKSAAPVTLPGKPEGAKWAKPPVFIDATYYRADGAGYLSKGFKQIFSLDANGGQARQLTHAPMDHSGPLSISPDGRNLYFSAVRDPEQDVLNSDIFRLDIATQTVTSLVARPGPDAHARLSPDGKTLAFTGFEDKLKLYEVTRLYMLDIASGKIHTVTESLARDVNDFHWRADSKGVYLSYDDHGESVIAWQPRTGKAKELTRDLGGTVLGRPYASGDFHVHDNLLVFTHNSTQRPAEIAVMHPRKGKVRLLTQLSRALNQHTQMAKVELLDYASSVDNLPLQAWIAYPPGFDPNKKYPLMLEIHGGPVANYGPRFSAEVQLYAAAGYVVVYANPRGSDSYGPDFVNEIHHNYPSRDYNDLMDAVDQVIAKGFIDSDRLFVTGGSGGGVLTAWIVGHTQRFKAAVVAKPVINWISFSLTADYYPYFSRYWFAKKPWEDSAHYMNRSPISYVGNVTTPTMLLTGEADYRTPMSETEQYYQALKLAGVKTAMVRIPEAGHSITARPSNLMNKVAYILWWFAEHGGPQTNVPENSETP